VPAEYPLLQLRNLVVFPRSVATVTLPRASSIAALDEAADLENRIVVATRKPIGEDGNEDTGVYDVATLAEIIQVQRELEGDQAQIVVEGLRRVHIEHFQEVGAYQRVRVVELQERQRTGATVEVLVRQVNEMFERYAKLNRSVGAEVVATATKTESAGRLADHVISNLPLDPHVKQGVLETLDHQERLERVHLMLANEIDVLELDQRIRARVRQQMDKNQREYYLKEQLKAINEELGNDQASEIAELRQKAEEKQLPEAAATRLARELSRLERMPSSSPEANIIRTYVDLILALPWNERTEDRLDVDFAQRVLDEDHYGLDKIKERIVEFLAVRQLMARNDQLKEMKGPILCFVGPPGVGKTSLGRSIARALSRKFVRLSLGGVRDEAEIRGHRRTYVGAMPGRLVQAMRSVGCRNPVIMLDEIDKLASDFRGDPSAALLEVLDPEHNNAFSDHYLDVPYDLSEVMFIATANVLWSIQRPLLDRMEVIELGGYTEEEKLQIGRRYLLPKQMRQHGLGENQLIMSDRVLRLCIQQYTREAGVRNLERVIASLCRKVARRVVADEGARVRVTAQNLADLLGPQRYRHGRAVEESQIGVATGLAWTEHGGELLPVEVATMPGKGALIITGRLGDVMQESARAALSYARARADLLHIEKDFQDKYDLHIHLPEGAVPKDGPSAGVTMASALVSALSRRPIRNNVAMTGEITLRGRVLPIGGLKEKTLAAHRAGITQIIAPLENQRDLPDIPKKIRNEMEFFWVENMDQVLGHVFFDRRSGGDLVDDDPKFEPEIVVEDPPHDSIAVQSADE
jgi:ATP-dependent Lon protease